MTGLAIVCTGRHTHPQTAAIAGDLHALTPGDGRRPRRKQQKGGMEYRCPECGQRRRLGERRMVRLAGMELAFREAGVSVPVDISFM